MIKITKDEIQAKYLALHNALGSRKDAEDKELFDQQHRQIWAACDIELKARKVELEAKETLSLKEQQELKELEVMLPTPIPVEPSPVFNPPPGTGIPEKVKYIEDFLKGLYLE